jgi:hypothetical protein
LGLFALQQAAVVLLPQSGPADWLRRAVLLLATSALVLLALQLRRLGGAWLVALGVFLNLLPMAAHGGLMPISIEVVQASGHFPGVTDQSVGQTVGRSKDIVLKREDIRFEWLSDRYAVIVPGYHPNVYSPGDLVLFVGLIVATCECLAGALCPRLGVGLLLPNSKRSEQALPAS